MKANRSVPGRNDEAVTSVLGAILIAALLVGVLVVIRVQFVPVWEENAEAAHMLQVENELSVLRAQIDRHVGDTSTVNVANQVTLGQSRASIFAQRSLPPTIAFQADRTEGKIDARNISILFADGKLVPTDDNEWVQIDSTTFVDEVGDILALRLRIPCMAAQPNPPGAPPECDDKTGHSVGITVTDRSGNFAGRFNVRVQSSGSAYTIVIETYNSSNQIVNTELRNQQQAQWFAPYFVNTLDDQLLFDQVLAAANKPLELALTHTPRFAGSAYSIVYFADDGSGDSALVGQGGTTQLNFNRTFSGGVASYAANNNYFVAQTYVVEHGALILHQVDGQVFKIPPAFAVAQAGSMTGVTIGTPSLKGIDKTLSGQMVSIVNTQRGAGQSFVGITEAFNYTVHTDYPQLWRQFFDEQFRRAEIPPTAYDITITPSASGPDTVRLMVLGTTHDPLVRDVSLSVVQADIRVRLEA